ncbi:MAG: T9SS type A sorting domain-containing protein [Bacteroidetes bacterium]|nr:T9SS type A sorting domain-containing protein [Bacteroidota bacterium]
MKKIFIAVVVIFSLPLGKGGDGLFAQQWHKLGTGVAYAGVSVECLKEINGDLYVGGGFATQYGAKGNGIAKYNSSTEVWDSVGCGLGEVLSIESYNGEIYAGGSFAYYLQPPTCNNWPPDSSSAGLAKWNGSYWGPVDTAMWGSSPDMGIIYAINFKNDLYMGGSLFSGSYMNMARYNGSTWDNMLGGIGGFGVLAMTVYKGDLIVAGSFTQAGLGGGNWMSANYIARWDGVKWDSLGSNGVNNQISSLTIDTVNDVLYAGGIFTMAGGIPAKQVAKWDGIQWSALPPLPAWSLANVHALKMFKGKLYASVTAFPSDTALLCFDGINWQIIYGPRETITAMEVYNGNLYVGGSFDKIDTTVVNCIACYGDSCPGTPITVTIGVNNLQTKSLKFKVYPNPAKGEINIEAEGKETKNYITRIYNSVGVKIVEQKFVKQTKISTSDFSKGIYQVQVCDKDGKICYTEKIVLD